MVASWAPMRVLMCSLAHWPNAADPPTRFISATRIPSTTRNTRIPTFQLSASLVTMPPSSWKNMVFIISSRLPLLYSSAPVRMPINRDEYASLVIRARAMATTGGSSDHTVA